MHHLIVICLLANAACQKLADKTKTVALTLPQPSAWTIMIIPDSAWEKRVGELGLDISASAITNVDKNITVMREEYISHTSAMKLRHTLAHELGHIRCACGSEEIAESLADKDSY